jgi:ubiquinol-cytochrome c reductase iron-sulfur subunit
LLPKFSNHAVYFSTSNNVTNKSANSLASDEAEQQLGYNSPDNLLQENQRSISERSSDPTNRAFTYFVLGGSKLVYASLARLTVMKVVSTMSASSDVLALASIEVDIGNIIEGQSLTVKWRGKPVFIRHRTSKEIAAAEADDQAELRDPQKDDERVQKKEWLVVLGVCTHLGCVPAANAGDYGGWFCPCHGSHYDTSGRIRKGPAPLNLEVPLYKFLDDKKVLIG